MGKDLRNQLEGLFSDILPAAGMEERTDGSSVTERWPVTLEGGATSEPASNGSSSEPDVPSATSQRDMTPGSEDALLAGAVNSRSEGEMSVESVPAQRLMSEAPPPAEVSERGPVISLAPQPSIEMAPRRQVIRMPDTAPLMHTILLAGLLIFLSFGLIHLAPIAWPGLRIAYVAACVAALALMGMQWKFSSTLSSALREAKQRQAADIRYQAQLEKRVSELIKTNAGLQTHIRQFQPAAQVFQVLTSALNPELLLRSAVNLIRDCFDLDYVGLFLIDETRHWAVLQAGTGQFGRQMLAQGHRLEVGGASSVGWCTAHARPRITRNVSEEPARFNAPLLPEIRWAVSLPLQFAGQVTGALDLQSTRSQMLSDEDITILQRLADQLAVAIHNAQAFAQLQARLAQVEALQSASAHEQRPRFRLDPLVTHYERRQPELVSLGDDWLDEARQAIAKRETVIRTATHNGKEHAALITPVALRNEVIGALGFEDSNRQHWTSDEIMLIRDVADQVALAVENTRLFEQTQAALAETEALYRASRRITSSSDLPSLYQVLVEETADHLGAEQCQLTIFDPQGGQGTIVAEYRATLDEPKGLVPMAGNPLYTILRDTQRPLAIEDVNLHPAVAHLREALVQRGVTSMLLVPIVARGELVGFLEVYAMQQGRVFSEAELDYCQTLASQAAITIDNMRAFEEQKETAERLREVDKLKTQFLANMSHELRTPLNSIIGFSRVILKGIDGPLTELQQNDLTAIYNSGQHLLGLINDILDLSKIEAGKMELNFEEVDLKPIIKGVMSTAVGLVKDKPITLEQHIPEDLPNIWADSTRIRQVLLNLISNSTKFTHSGKISLSASYDAEWVTIRVSDTGIGIPTDKLESIFEEFTQVDGSTTRSVGGTGLGLPISRHFIEMHGGKISVESQTGVGSVFTVVLPIHIHPESSAQPVEDQTENALAASACHTVLAVDDDPGVISLYRRYLEREGYHVIGITSSQNVLAQAMELQPFAITLDVLMPHKDGWQVLRELKECPATEHIPILICSIVSNEGLGFSLGAADYLVKPIMEEELLAALSRLNRPQKEEKEVEVLVIDDQADDILLIRRILEAQHHYHVVGVDGGQSGIDRVRQCQPDVIILDLMMPEVDGFAVLEALKGQPDTRDIPIIVITAKELTEEEHQRLNGHVEILLRKGLFTEQELLEDLGKALSRIKLYQPA